jgi:hypothetical protein
MQKIILSIAAFILLGSLPLFSQADSTKYINGLPVSEDDTARFDPDLDLEPHNRVVRVPADRLPEKLREVLEEEAIYRGWQDTIVYYQKNTGLYIVPIRYREGIKIFGVTENGKPVTFSEVNTREDQ